MVIRPHLTPRRLLHEGHRLSQLRLRQQLQHLHQLAQGLVLRIVAQPRPPPPRHPQRRGVVQQPVEVLAERPERPQFGQIGKQLLQVGPLGRGQLGGALDDQGAVLPDEGRFLLGGRPAPPPSGLLPLAGAASTALAALPPPPRLRPPQAADGIEHLVQHVPQQMEDA